MKRMLINATQVEEKRLAIVDGQKLLDYEIEIEGREQRKGNIYKAIVTRVEPSLEACFVDYGEDRHGFLPFKEISKQYFNGNVSPSQARIQDVIREGQDLFVQVEKEERGNKGAALTTFISLAGRYVVLMPNNPRGGGVSRRIEGEDRAELKEAMDQLQYPQGCSIIARTAGIGRTAPELQWDLNYLLKLWSAIDSAGKGGKGAFLIYQESSLVIRAIRDYFHSDVGDILIDTDDIYEQAQQFMAHVMPEHANKVKRYRDDVALFSRFQIEHQIETAYARTVNLPSGGAIVIDQTEALVSVDVNSARAIKGGDIEETATRTNLEAADEVARQMRLRDLGGLVVIDFIDMDESRNRRDVENRLRDALRQDRARVQFGTISKFGLMEMSRQRLRPTLSEGASIPCPRCGGSGHVRDTESSALQILRIIQEESIKENTAAVWAQVPVEVASFLLNEKRTEVAKVELKQRINVVLIPNKTLETPNYKLERLKHDDPRLDNMDASYKMAEEIEDPVAVTRRSQEPTNRQTPVIKGVLPDAPAPTAQPRAAAAATPAEAPSATNSVAAGAISKKVSTEKSAEKGFFSWLKGLFGAGAAAGAAPAPLADTETRKDATTERSNERPGRSDGREGRRDAGRGGRGGRGGERGERAPKAEGRGEPRADRGERSSEPRGERPERNERADRGERNERGGRRGERAPRSEPLASEGASLNTEAAVNEQRPDLREPRAPRGEGRSEGRSEGRAEGRDGGRRERGERGGERRERGPRNEGIDVNAAQGVAGAVATGVIASATGQPNAAQEGETELQAQARERYERRARRENTQGAPSEQPSPETAPVEDAQSENRTHEGERPSGEGEQRERRSRERHGRDRQGRGGDRGERREQGDHSEANFAANNQQNSPQLPLEYAQAAPNSVANEAPSTAIKSTPLPHSMPSVGHYVLPIADMAQVATGAGLQWVNSNPEKIAAVQAAIAAEPKSVHVPRERAAPVVQDTEPLILVETKRDLRNMTLPFEQAQH